MRGWRRIGSRERFRYVDERGEPITDAAQLARIRALAIPPAWTDVWISPDPAAKLQAVAVDAAGRRQYRYHADFRAERERVKFDRLVRFGEHLPHLRAAMAADMQRELLARDRVSATALRLIDHGWFRVGSERYVERGTYGIATLLKRHAHPQGAQVRLQFVGKDRIWVRRAIVDAELSAAIAELKRVPGGPRLFRYRREDGLHNLTSERLNAYIDRNLGIEFMAKDFRTWGGTLTAAIALAERGPARTKAEQMRALAAAMRRVAERLGNTPAVARASYVAPAVVDEYLEGRTLADCRPRRLRVVDARASGLDLEELELLTLCRSWRSRREQAAA
jgi:DNA topoisomerase I